MNQNVLQNIEKLEDSLWEAADNLRANSKLRHRFWKMTQRYDDNAK